MSDVPMRLVALPEILSALGVSSWEFKRWRTRGLTPRIYVMPNRQIRMRESDLLRWVAESYPHPLPSLSMAQAADEFGVTLDEFRRWVRNGLITGVPEGLSEDGRIARETLEAWAESLPSV